MAGEYQYYDLSHIQSGLFVPWTKKTLINHVTHMRACLKGSLENKKNVFFKCRKVQVKSRSSWFPVRCDLCDLVVMTSTNLAGDALIFAGKNLAKHTEFLFDLSEFPVIRALPFQISDEPL